MTTKYPVTHNAQAQRKTRNRWIVVSPAAGKELAQRNAVLCDTLSGGVKVLRIDGKHATSGKGSLSAITAGKKRAHRKHAAHKNDYTDAAYGIATPTTKRKTTSVRKTTSKKSSPKTITINGLTGTPEDLRKLLKL